MIFAYLLGKEATQKNLGGGLVMRRKILLVTMLSVFLMGCATMTGRSPSRQEVVLKVETPNSEKVAVHNGNGVNKSMIIPNPEGSLSPLSFISKDKAFVKIFSGLTVDDVTKLWNDLCVLENNTNIRVINLFISSPGGDAFSGLALADQIERAKRKGFHITAHASGIVASAAVPVFAVCDRRLAAPGTIFMVHEASLWKWPGRETASDIRAQHELLNLLRDRYIGKLAKYSKLDKENWEKLEYNTTWFSAEKAKIWGLVDAIE